MKAQPNSVFVAKGKIPLEYSLIAILISPPKLSVGALSRTRINSVLVHGTGFTTNISVADPFNNPTAMILDKKDWESLGTEPNFEQVFAISKVAYELPITLMYNTDGERASIAAKGAVTGVDVKMFFTDYDSIVSDDFYLVIARGVVVDGNVTYRVQSDRVDITQDEYMKYFVCEC